MTAGSERFLRGAAVLSLLLAAAVFAAADPAEFDRRALKRIQSPPGGLPPVPVPEANPPTAAKIRLGRRLFLDRRLSVNGTLSCAMCHVPEQGFTVNEIKTAVGNQGRSLRRNAPTLLNVAYAGPFFHDGREPDLDLQAFDVFLNPDEMAAPSLGAIVANIRSLPDYRPLFDAAYGGPAGVENIGQAIGTYMRTLLSGGSRFDRWYFEAKEKALGPAARRGFELFTGNAGCSGCHSIGPEHALFTDGRYHDTGLGWARSTSKPSDSDRIQVEIAPGRVTEIDRAAVDSVGDSPAGDLGRYEVTGDPADRWSFKTPTLRNVALTAPYMHDGSISTLREVVEFYDRGGHPHDGLDPLILPLGLQPAEIDAVVAFLEGLTGDNIEELIDDARSEEVGNPGVTD
jgi:cytochrome c peroxidase